MQNEIIALLKEKNLAEARKRLAQLNEADIAELFDELSNEEIICLFRLLPKSTGAEVFAYLEPDVQQKVIEAMTDKELKEVLDDLHMDDAADLLEEMPANVVKRVLQACAPQMRGTLNTLLNYPEDSAGSIMTTEYVDLKRDMTVQQAFDHIRNTGVDKETIYTCYVINASRVLEGVVTVRELLLAAPDAIVGNLMNTHDVVANTHETQSEVAMKLSKYDLLSIPVVDAENRLVGIVTFDDAMDVIEEETTEDIEIMAGMTPSDKPYMKTGVLQIWLKRIPWLLLLMISATFTGMIISSFEDALKVHVVLTSFIPMLMDTGGNSGSQSSVTIIRGLSLGEIEFRDIFRIIWKEIRVSVLCGLALAVVGFLKILLIDRLLLGNMDISLLIAAVVSITLLATVVVAKIIGCTLPLVASKIGFDPAVMASPFITTIVDAVSLLIYFAAAKLILGI